MGYTTSPTKLLIGLGVSSISDSWNASAQNVKVVEEYTTLVNSGVLPVFKGHFLNEEDLILRSHILNIMCRLKTSWQKESERCLALYEGLERLDEMDRDGLVILEPYALHVTNKGRAFLRNICMTLDARLWRHSPEKVMFSAAV